MLLGLTRDLGIAVSLAYLASALVLSGCAGEPGGVEPPPRPQGSAGSAGASTTPSSAGASGSSSSHETTLPLPSSSATTPHPDALTHFEHCNTDAPTVLASGQSGGGAIAVDGTRVYYGTRRGVMTVPIEGGAPELLAAAGTPIQIALDDQSVYFSDNGILRVDKTGGKVEVLVDMVTAGLAIRGSAVYFSTWARQRTGIQRWSDGTLQSLVEFKGEEWVPRLLVADDDLYYAPLSSSGSSLQATRYDFGAETFHALTPIALARSFAVADGYLYFTDESSLTVRKVPVAGGAPVELAAFVGYPVAIAADAAHVYFTLHDLEPNTHQYSGRVIRMSVDGAELCELAAFDSYVTALTIDERYVYWLAPGTAEDASAAVMRAPK